MRDLLAETWAREEQKLAFLSFVESMIQKPVVYEAKPTKVVNNLRKYLRNGENVKFAVNSSFLYIIKYLTDTATLIIDFQDGSSYEYYGVPPKAIIAMAKAPSHGQFFHKYIRNNPAVDYEQVS